MKTNGTVWGWGQNYYGQLGDADQSNKYVATRLSEISGVQNVASGESFSLFLTSLEDVLPNAPKLGERRKVSR